MSKHTSSEFVPTKTIECDDCQTKIRAYHHKAFMVIDTPIELGKDSTKQVKSMPVVCEFCNIKRMDVPF